MNDKEIPRRNDINRNTPAEIAIRNAVDAVEGVGAHPLLTDAVVLLDKAREKLADYIDRLHVKPAVVEPQSDLGKLLAALSSLNAQAMAGVNVASAIKQADEAVKFRSHARADG